MAKITKSLLVTPADEGRIDIVVQRLTNAPRAVIRGMFDNDCVVLDGVVCSDAGERVAIDMKVSVNYDPNIRYKEKPRTYQSRIFDLVYEDEHLIVINKEAGFLTVPTDAREKNTVVAAVHSYVNRGRGKGRGRLVGIVHRLDRDTSGLLVFGKNEVVTAKLKNQFAARKPEREYFAVVAGQLRQNKGTIQSYLATDNALNQHSTTREDEGKLAITHYTVVTTFRDATLIRVTLETGRRNQIRVHFAEQGHPILGDQRYETENARHALWPHRRLALHAASLGFKHPVTGEIMRFKAETPSEFTRFSKQAKT